LDYLFKQYLPQGINLKDPKVSPYWHTSHKNLPPHDLYVSEYDGLRGHTDGYHEKLLKNGVKSELHIFEGQIHPFFMGRGYFNDGENPVMTVLSDLNTLSHRNLAR